MKCGSRAVIPVRQLEHLEIFVLLLQVVHADPQQVGNQSAKTAQRHRGDRQHRRRALQLRETRQSQLVPLLHQHSLRQRRAKQQDDRDGREQDFVGFAVHELSSVPLRSGQFAPVENKYAERRQ